MMMFDRNVPSGGYAWWYVDAISENADFGITLIAFVGSVFSPYYFRARKKNAATNPDNYCALNIAFHENQKKYWCMTERSAKHVYRSSEIFEMANSSITWNGSYLEFKIQEYTVPLPSKVSGVVRVHPHYINTNNYFLEDSQKHAWCPIAPCSHVEVEMQRPNFQWHATGYFDSNWGAEPLENGFRSWNWSCTKMNEEERVIQYHTVNRNNTNTDLGFHFASDGKITAREQQIAKILPETKIWRVPRKAYVEDDRNVNVLKTLEDTPFYSRSVLNSETQDKSILTIHESLELDRFKKPLTQFMLPFRMPRQLL